MIAYLTQSLNPDNENLPSECPWVSWFYNEGDPLPDNALILPDEEYNALHASFLPLILREKDRVTMRKRAEAKDGIIGDIGSENKERIRNGIWTVADLIGLTETNEFKAIMNDIDGLSFELAQSKVMAWVHPLITTEIKLSIVGKLQENLYL